MAAPKLLLLDEPMAEVNPTLALSIAERLEELRGEGVTMLMVGHELAWIAVAASPASSRSRWPRATAPG